jgi:predicted metal-dependent hydrolase
MDRDADGNAVPRIALFNPFRRAKAAPETFARELLLDDRPLAYRLTRCSRRTIAVHVRRDGVEVRAPHRVALAVIEDFMRSKARWIRRKLSDATPARPFHWASGSELTILGEPVRLAAAPGQKGVTRDGEWLRIGDVPARRVRKPSAPALPATGQEAPATPGTGDDAITKAWRKAVVAWLREAAMAHFAYRAAVLAEKLSVPMPALKLSNAASQWGSCIRHGHEVRVLLHWKLYLLPPHLIDYVVAHELAHIRELNHSPRFWAEVERIYPAAAEARRELRLLGRKLPQL